MTELNNKMSTIGKRLKYLRAMSQLSRDKVKQKCNISSATLRSWEDDKVVVSDEKLNLCLYAYSSLGIISNLEWIKFGIGDYPIIKLDRSKTNIYNTQNLKNDLSKEQDKILLNNEDIYVDAISLTINLLDKNNIKSEFDTINKIALNIYEYSQKQNKLCIYYAKNAINLLISLNVFDKKNI